MTETKAERKKRLAKEQAKRYREKHREELRRKAMLYKQENGELIKKRREARIEKIRELDKLNKLKHHHKTLARNTVNNLIKAGKLQRGRCSVCDKPDAEAHHDDYSKPLEITWLCTKHHKERHHIEKTEVA